MPGATVDTRNLQSTRAEHAGRGGGSGAFLIQTAPMRAGKQTSGEEADPAAVPDKGQPPAFDAALAAARQDKKQPAADASKKKEQPPHEEAAGDVSHAVQNGGKPAEPTSEDQTPSADASADASAESEPTTKPADPPGDDHPDQDSVQAACIAQSVALAGQIVAAIPQVSPPQGAADAGQTGQPGGDQPPPAAPGSKPIIAPNELQLRAIDGKKAPQKKPVAGSHAEDIPSPGGSDQQKPAKPATSDPESKLSSQPVIRPDDQLAGQLDPGQGIAQKIPILTRAKTDAVPPSEHRTASADSKSAEKTQQVIPAAQNTPEAEAPSVPSLPIEANKPELKAEARPVTEASLVSGAASNGEAPHSAAIAPPAQESRPAPANDLYDQVVLGLKGKLDARSGKAEITLDPPNLGTLKVSVALENGVLTAEFQSASDVVRELLSNHLDKLKTVLQGQGVAVDRLAVGAPVEAAGSGAQGQQASFGSAAHDGRSAGGFGQEQRPGQQRPDNGRFSRLFARTRKEPIDLVA